MGFSRQEYWSGLPCPPVGDLPNPGIEPVSLASPISVDRFFTSSTTWEAQLHTHRHTHSSTLLCFSLSSLPWKSTLLHGECSAHACESTCDSWTSGPADCMVLHHPYFRCMVFLCGDQILSPRCWVKFNFQRDRELKSKWNLFGPQQ